MTSHPLAIELSRRRSAGPRFGAGTAMALALFAPLTAEANTGIGLAGQVWGVMFVVLVPVIFVEALVVWRLWKVGIGRALWWMTLANLASTIAGAFIGVVAEAIFVDGGRRTVLGATAGAMVGSLLFLFVTSWLIEWGIIRGNRPQGAAASAMRVAFVANAASYSLIVTAILAFPGLREPPTLPRAAVAEALAEISLAKPEIAEHFQTRGEFPEPKVLSTDPRGRLRSLKRESGGRLVAELRIPGHEGLHGKSLVLEPRLREGRVLEWTCHTPDAPYPFLPANCRQGPPKPSRP